MNSLRDRSTSAFVLAACIGVTSCGGSEERASAASADLAAGVVAEVAGTPIPATLVERAARESGESSEQALRELIRGELFVSYMRAEEPEFAGAAERGSFARALLDSLRREVLGSGGPISAREVDEIVQARWVEYARPRSVRTAHAVALPRGPEHRDAARAFAERLKVAVNGVTDPNEFADRVRAYDAEHGSPETVEVRVEALPPVAEDGRTVPVDVLDGGGPPALVVEYAEAAHRLQTAGDQSPVVETDYGFHVLLAIEVLAEKKLAPADARALVRREALALRARPERERLLAELRASTAIEVARNATELTRVVGAPR